MHKQLLNLIEENIKVITKDKTKKYALLLSGGIDSSIIAAILKKNKIKFTSYFFYAKDTNKAKDQEFVNLLKKELDLDLKIINSNKEEIKKIIPLVINTIDSTNPVDIGIATPLFFLTKEIKKEKKDFVLSGFGADELFGGYNVFTPENLIKKREEKLKNINIENLFRDKAISKYFNINYYYPFLNKKIIDFTKTLSPELLITEKDKKIILKKIAKELKLPSEIINRKKLAMQYGSNTDKIIEKIAKENKYKSKKEYLESIRKKKCAVLYSSGKDSNLSLWFAHKDYDVSCLVSMIPANSDSYMFQTPDVSILKQQAKSLGLPIVIKKTKGEKEKELIDLEKELKNIKKKHNIKIVVSGAIKSNYQKERLEKICNKLNLELVNPLWHISEKKEMDLLLKNGFKFIIDKIAAYGLTEDYLGKIITSKEIEELEVKSKKYGFNLIGEGGDYETVVLDSPLFSYQIKIIESKKQMENEFTGKLNIKNTKFLKK